ncbi:unnamed protein product [Caenorhabditis auriculariae]|uniref:Uncharacterized protein n=1 Tax=Caenorhabditis auriculariae TaxID=2777116 RepID=A0A8S1HXA8_9PELO|nr:unnamed protein product [Caenorhabditis auriculariae]
MPPLTDRQREELIRKERQRRRIARLQQVRQQASEHARITRENVRQKQEEVLTEIRIHVDAEVQDIVSDMIINGDITPRQLSRRSMSSRTSSSISRSSKKKSRRRTATREDNEKAMLRNRQALSRLRKTREKELEQRAEKLGRRQAANEMANLRSRGAFDPPI